MKDKVKSIYDLELNESIIEEFGEGTCTVMRVPGGWIYLFTKYNGEVTSSVFVKYSREFYNTPDVKLPF